MSYTAITISNEAINIEYISGATVTKETVSEDKNLLARNTKIKAVDISTSGYWIEIFDLQTEHLPRKNM